MFELETQSFLYGKNMGRGDKLRGNIMGKSLTYNAHYTKTSSYSIRKTAETQSPTLLHSKVFVMLILMHTCTVI